MKIALLIPTMDRGGAEKQVVLLAAGLRAAGHDVHVILLTRDGPRSSDLRSAGVAVHVIGKRFKADPTALTRLVALLTRLQPELVHTFLFAANSFGRVAALWTRRRTRYPRVILASERCVDLWKQPWQFAIDRRLARFSDAITTNSHGVVDFYETHGLARDRFVVIPNGVPSRAPVQAPVSRAEAYERLGVSLDRRLILSVGRLWPQKRVRDLIWAGELLGTMRHDTTLVIIGDGPQRGELLRHRDAVSRPANVLFAGQRDDVADLLPHADAFWIASEYEGQSNAVIEAMQAGVPVVASNIPGNRDLIEPGQTGWLFDVGEELELARHTETLLGAPEMVAEITQRARDRIESEFSVAAMVDRHVELYQTCLLRQAKTELT